jgi:hypothetical protein
VPRPSAAAAQANAAMKVFMTVSDFCNGRIARRQPFRRAETHATAEGTA